jgi:lactate permease
VLLIYLMTKRNSMPSFKALPLSALVLYLIVLIVFAENPNQVHAAILDGLLVSWTPILIISGAILLFRSMEATGGLAHIRLWLNVISPNPVAQLMIVGWSFQFLIEGASGFGTPAAIAAPVLVGLGFPALRVAIFCLILNSVPVTFGAVGTPIWFGFSIIELSPVELSEVSLKAAMINTFCAPFIVFIALSFLVSPQQLLKNWLFILLSTFACTLPYLFMAVYSNEFPSLIGGAVGLAITVFLASSPLGRGKIERNTISKDTSAIDETPVVAPSLRTLTIASFPLWGTVLILMLTRIPQLGLKSLLVAQTPAVSLPLGSLGELSISAALVISLKNIFQTSEVWSHSLLYVPSLIPFGLMALITLRASNVPFMPVLMGTIHQMRRPVLALMGALVFVNLMMLGDESSAVALIGRHLAQLSGSQWLYFATLLGALGAFFSGSATISNLTFGAIQVSIAESLQLNTTTILALQAAGAAMGNMISINNIVAVSSVLALGNQEGYIIKRTLFAMLIYAALAALMAVFLS